MQALYTLTQRQLQGLISSKGRLAFVPIEAYPDLSANACRRYHSRKSDMAYGELIAALSLIGASQTPASPPPSIAPQGTPETRYCLRVDALIGSRVETIQCRTRAEWAELQLDVDQEWAENGVRTIS
jgi:hypothetical protein